MVQKYQKTMVKSINEENYLHYFITPLGGNTAKGLF